MTEQPLLKVSEVADLLRVNHSTVYRLIAKPDGLKAYKIGKCTRFKRSEVEAYLDACAVKTPQAQGRPEIARFTYKPGMKVVSL